VTGRLIDKVSSMHFTATVVVFSRKNEVFLNLRESFLIYEVVITFIVDRVNLTLTL